MAAEGKCNLVEAACTLLEPFSVGKKRVESKTVIELHRNHVKTLMASGFEPENFLAAVREINVGYPYYGD